MDAMDAATKAKYQKYLDEQLFTESALESAYDNGLFNGRDLGIKEGIKKGIKEGIKEGITLGQQKTLKKGVTELLAMGMNLHDIGKVFGLTTGEVEGIIGAKDLLK
jgi:flagellar biosynthesis/type III secretory pathway protein FliH